MVMKPEVKDRIMSHENPVTAAIYNSKFNQVARPVPRLLTTIGSLSTDNADETIKLIAEDKRST